MVLEGIGECGVEQKLKFYQHTDMYSIHTSWSLNHVTLQCIFLFRDLRVIGLGLDAFMYALHMIGYYKAIIQTHLEQNTFNTSPINNAYYGASTTPCNTCNELHPT